MMVNGSWRLYDDGFTMMDKDFHFMDYDHPRYLKERGDKPSKTRFQGSRFKSNPGSENPKVARLHSMLGCEEVWGKATNKPSKNDLKLEFLVLDIYLYITGMMLILILTKEWFLWWSINPGVDDSSPICTSFIYVPYNPQ